MKQGIRKDIDWPYAGALLAHGDSVNQTAFFKAFVKECLSWSTRYQVEMQLAFVNGELTDEEKDVLAMLPFKERK